jgi:hypothetical protein
LWPKRKAALLLPPLTSLLSFPYSVQMDVIPAAGAKRRAEEGVETDTPPKAKVARPPPAAAMVVLPHLKAYYSKFEVSHNSTRMDVIPSFDAGKREKI